MGDYGEILKRLEQCRRKMDFTQQNLGMVLGIKQSQYSYEENGHTKISDKHLIKLQSCGFDIDYIITGENLGKEYDRLIGSFANFGEDKKGFLLRMFGELIINVVNKYERVERKEEKYVNLLSSMLKSWENFSILWFVREQKGYRQEDMARHIGVGVKTYRKLEREQKYPDAEMAQELYEMSGYPPSLFFNFVDRREFVISKVWRLLLPEDQKMILQVAKYVKRMLS